MPENGVLVDTKLRLLMANVTMVMAPVPIASCAVATVGASLAKLPRSISHATVKQTAYVTASNSSENNCARSGFSPKFRDITNCQCNEATSSASTNARAAIYMPSRLPVPAPNKIIAHMPANASSIPMTQNQMGITPSKYWIAIIAGRPISPTAIVRRSGTRR